MNWPQLSSDTLVAIAVLAGSLILAAGKLRAANLSFSTRIWMALVWFSLFLGITALAGLLLR